MDKLSAERSGHREHPVFIPSLVVRLHHLEQEKGAPLDRDDVAGVCRRAMVLWLDEASRKQLDEKRGYRDIDPDHAWEEWQTVRLEPAPIEPSGSRSPWPNRRAKTNQQ